MKAFILGLASFSAVVALAFILATAGIGRWPGDADYGGGLLLQRYSEMALGCWLLLFRVMFRMQFPRAEVSRNLRIHLNTLVFLLLADGMGNAVCAANKDTAWAYDLGRYLIRYSVILAGLSWARMNARGQSIC